MNFPLRRAAAFLLVGASCLAELNAAVARSDVLPPERRRPPVELAQRLANRPPPPPLPADIVHPFDPAAFGQPDPEELKAIAAAKAAAAANVANARPTTDRGLLDIIAARITPSGTLILGGEPLLIFGQKRLRVGDRLTVSYDGQDYNLELTAIERTTFTLRLNRDEITRPIKPGK